MKPHIAQKAPYAVEVTAGQSLLLVLLRPKQESTILRWQS